MSTKGPVRLQGAVSRVADVDTGEQYEAYTVYKGLDEENFVKVQIEMLLKLLNVCQSRQTSAVAVHVIKNTKLADNLFFGSYSEIAEATSISKRTVIKAMNELMNNKLVGRLRDGVYQVSPGLIYHGRPTKRDWLLRVYAESVKPEDRDEAYIEAAKTGITQRKRKGVAGAMDDN